MCKQVFVLSAVHPGNIPVKPVLQVPLNMRHNIADLILLLPGKFKPFLTVIGKRLYCFHISGLALQP